jgi:O-antigen/teichoic acid export membrane protein
VSFARQSLGSLAALVVGVVVSILLPRVLGPEARGEYQLAVKVAGLVLAIAQWGIPEVLLQALAERRGKHTEGALIGTSLVLGLVAAALIALVLGAAAPLFQDNLLKGVDPTLLAIALVGSLASLVGLLVRRFIQLGGRLDIYNGLDIARTLLFLVLVAVGGALLPRNAFGPTLAWLIGEVALATAATAFLLRRLGTTGRWQADAGLGRELASSGAPIQFGLLGMFVGSEGGAFVLNANLDVAAVGIYSVALSVSRLVLQISVALRTALQPRLMANEQDSGAMTARVTRHGLLWMLLIALALAVGSPLVPLIFTRDFSAVGPAMVLLLPGMVAYGVWQLLASHLLRIGRRGFLAVVAWLFGITSIALQAIGAQIFGVPGAAAGLSLAYVIATCVVLVRFVQMSGRPVRELLPAMADVAFYVGLTRRALARNAA